MSWNEVELLDSVRYQELSTITRSLHLREAMISYSTQRLSSHKMQTRDNKVTCKVLWFAPTKPLNQNNMYGNVSFTLDWSKAKNQLGPYLYYIDQYRTDDIIYSRVLLSNKRHWNLTPVNTNESGMPVWKIGSQYYVATASAAVPHVVEIGIEADASRGKWLYANCKVQANDHSSANMLQYPGGPYNPCICHRFNYFNKVCPSSYPAYQTRAILLKKCPMMLRDVPLLNYHSEMLSFTDEQDSEPGYEDNEYIADYDDHKLASRPAYRLQAGVLHTNAQAEVSASNNASYRTTPRASWFQETTKNEKQDDGWSTGSKIALAAGGLALFAGLAAAFTADSIEDKKKNKNGGSE